jgi:hypothetical protein
MKTTIRLGRRSQGTPKFSLAFLGGCLAAWSVAAADAAPAEKAAADAPSSEKPGDAGSTSDSATEDYRNWFDVSVGGLLLRDDRAQFKRRYQRPRDVFGGVEDFHFEQDLGKKGLLKLEGRGLFDDHDYSLKLDVNHPDIGYLRAGYREFRTWYDGSGGFSPLPRPGGLWFVPDGGEEQALDRGEVWVEGGLTLPEKPQLSFEYRHLFRKGGKDSLVWGDTALTGAGVRGVVPSFRLLDEKRDLFGADIKQRLGKTEVGVGVRYDLETSTDSLNVSRRPGEFSSAPGTQTPTRRMTQREDTDTDLFNVHASTDTRFNENTWLTSGFSYTSLNADFTGQRVFGRDYAQGYDPTFRVPASFYTGFTNLAASSHMKQYVLTLNMLLTPWKNVAIVPAVRVEKNDLNGDSSAVLVNPPAADAAVAAANSRAFLDVSESLEARYTGVTNWVYYLRGYWLQGEGGLKERENARLSDFTLNRDTDFDRFTQQYTAGANWYASRRVNFAAQYYFKKRENDYSNRFTPANRSVLNRYPGYLAEHDFDTHDGNFRVSWRPAGSLSLVSRYDFQRSTIHLRTTDLPDLESARQTSHILGESITWTPWARLYLQGGVSYVWDKTKSPASQALGSRTPVLDASNDYWNATGSAGLAVSRKTDLQATYSYYRANDYQDNSTLSQPYGAGAEEHGVTGALIHRLRKNLTWTLRYGYYRGRDETSGWRNDYEAHLVYSSWQYRF